MLLGVISDTHGHAANTRDAVRMFESLEVEALIHCGDIGTPEVIELLARWPTHYVLGNVDYDRQGLEMAIRNAGQTFHGTLGRIELAGRRIALTHGDNLPLLRSAIADGQADLVCHGHTHLAGWRDESRTRVLNPGAVYRANPHTVAVVELPTLDITIVPLH